MHISETMLITLVANGWRVEGMKARKTDYNVAPATSLNPLGARTLYVEFDESGRWLSVTDAWGKVLKDFDTRDWLNVTPTEFAAHVERVALSTV